MFLVQGYNNDVEIIRGWVISLSLSQIIMHRDVVQFECVQGQRMEIRVGCLLLRNI